MIRRREHAQLDSINLLPGPVKISPAVHEAFCRPAISHRSAIYDEQLDRVTRRLRELTSAQHATLLLGSGTLANDAVAAQLRSAGRGLVLVNGHFGWRLSDHARRAGLDFETETVDWGRPLPYENLAARLHGPHRPAWLWAVHHETSTGVLNDLPRLAAMAEAAGTKLCIDAISSIGTVPMDLSLAHLASGVSGKALAAFPGLAFVLHRQAIASDPGVPRYLDLGMVAEAGGVPFTSSSNLLAALDVALHRLDGESRCEQVFAAKRQLSRWLRGRVEASGCALMAAEDVASPANLTLRPPPGCSAFALGERLDAAGIFLSYRSSYLVRRNLIQVCLFSDHDQTELEALLPFLPEATAMPKGALVPRIAG